MADRNREDGARPRGCVRPLRIGRALHVHQDPARRPRRRLPPLVFSFFAPQEDPLKHADNAFERKEYGAALAAYQPRRSSPSSRRSTSASASAIGVTLARLERFDEALAALGSSLCANPDALWFGRALLERGVIAATMPHNAYEKDGKRTRGHWVQGATYVWTAQEDFRERDRRPRRAPASPRRRVHDASRDEAIRQEAHRRRARPRAPRARRDARGRRRVRRAIDARDRAPRRGRRPGTTAWSRRSMPRSRPRRRQATARPRRSPAT